MKIEDLLKKKELIEAERKQLNIQLVEQISFLQIERNRNKKLHDEIHRLNDQIMKYELRDKNKRHRESQTFLHEFPNYHMKWRTQYVQTEMSFSKGTTNRPKKLYDKNGNVVENISKQIKNE